MHTFMNRTTLRFDTICSRPWTQSKNAAEDAKSEKEKQARRVPHLTSLISVITSRSDDAGGSLALGAKSESVPSLPTLDMLRKLCAVNDGRAEAKARGNVWAVAAKWKEAACDLTAVLRIEEDESMERRISLATNILQDTCGSGLLDLRVD